MTPAPAPGTSPLPPVLVTSIGTARDYHETLYRLGDREHATRFASVALARIGDLRGARALVVLTRAAREQWYEPLAAALREEGVEPVPVEIPDGRTDAEILDIFARLVLEDARNPESPFRIPPGSPLVLDVTLALRHLPFVYLAALSYLVGLHDVDIRGIYYGAYELRAPDGATPLIDISSQFNLIEWYHALRSARQTGDLSGVTREIASTVKALHAAGAPLRELGRIRGDIARLSGALAEGLPFEVGIHAESLRRSTTALAGEAGRDIGARIALRSLVETLDVWALPDPVEQKADIPLGRDELARQLRLARWYIDHGHVGNALRLLREWMISFVMHSQPWTYDRWMDRDVRQAPEHILNGLAYRAQLDLASEPEKALARTWNAIGALRNKLAHAGHHLEPIAISPERAQNLLAACESLLDDPLPEHALRQPEGRLIVTPLGLSPGVLYTLLTTLEARHLLVVSSPKARAGLEEALEKAGATAIPSTVMLMDDPHQGFEEARRLATPAVRELMLRHSEVLVNITGGTGAMHFGINLLSEEARHLGVTTRRVALIDRRPPEAQRLEPYVRGEVFWLDDAVRPEEEP